MREQKRHTITSPVLRFRRWSRRRYAAFVSVTHCVSIGQLANNVADRLRKKSDSKCLEGIGSVIPGRSSSFETDETRVEDEEQALLDLFLRSISLTLEPVSLIGHLFILIRCIRRGDSSREWDGSPLFCVMGD